MESTGVSWSGHRNRTENGGGGGGGTDNKQVTPAERLLDVRIVWRASWMLSTVITISFPHLQGLEWQLIYLSIVRPLRQRKEEKELHLLKYKPWINFCHGFLSPGPLGVYAEKLFVKCPLVCGCYRAPLHQRRGDPVQEALIWKLPLLSPATRARRLLVVVLSGSWETTYTGVAHRLLYVGLGLSGCFLNLILSIYLKRRCIQYWV